jgi:hypothetical protein
LLQFFDLIIIIIETVYISFSRMKVQSLSVAGEVQGSEVHPATMELEWVGGR